mmetsp:Transcript_2371/g.6729  ORF Transcript_2371/g.6729 Transcript_2371/m.6729 type:complete len:108 (-) Transcript_2371:422-745(-)
MSAAGRRTPTSRRASSSTSRRSTSGCTVAVLYELLKAEIRMERKRWRSGAARRSATSLTSGSEAMVAELCAKLEADDADVVNLSDEEYAALPADEEPRRDQLQPPHA